MLAPVCVHSGGVCNLRYCGLVTPQLLLPACSAVWSHRGPTLLAHGPSTGQNTQLRLAIAHSAHEAATEKTICIINHSCAQVELGGP